MTYDPGVNAVKIKDVAEQFQLKPSAIRYYEEYGLLPPAPRTPGNYRIYRPEDLNRLSSICELRRLGFSLPDIQALLECSSASCLRETFRRHRHAIEAEIHEAMERRSQLVEMEEALLESMTVDLSALLERASPDGTVDRCKWDEPGDEPSPSNA
jgi:DNA-binding transcriptional MerR regulator